MKNLKVSMKLVVSFVVVLVMALAVGIIGIFGMYSINASDDDLYNYNVLSLAAMGNAREIFQDQRVLMRNYALNGGNAAKIEEYAREMAASEADMLKEMGEYEASMADPSDEDDYFEGKNAYLGDFASLKREVYEASLISMQDGYNAIYTDRAVNIVNTIVGDFDSAMSSNEQWAHIAVNDNTDLFMFMLILEIIILAVAVIVGLFFAFYISGLIAKPLAPLTAYMGRASTTGDIEFTAERRASSPNILHRRMKSAS